MVHYLSCDEGKGGGKDILSSAQNATLHICWSIIKYLLFGSNLFYNLDCVFGLIKFPFT